MSITSGEEGRAIVPVLKTFRKLLNADALFLWELFDDRPIKKQHGQRKSAEEDDRPIKKQHLQRMSTEEKESLCARFYEFLQGKKSDFVSYLTKQKVRSPEEMIDFFKCWRPKGERGPEGEYSILKFVQAVTNEEKIQPFSFEYGEGARPRKYVVLDGTRGLRTVRARKLASPAVLMEGITSYHVRTNTSGRYSRADLSSDLKDVEIGLNYDRITSRTVSDNKQVDRCMHLLVLPLTYKDDVTDRIDVIGAIKAENYDDRPFLKQNTKLAESFLGFLGKFIVDSRDGARAQTYQELCKGEKLVKHLREVKRALEPKKSRRVSKSRNDTENSEHGVIIQVIESLIHLFDVFNRGTYTGWADIAGRINHFAMEITPILELPKFELFEELEKFRRYDELLYEDVPQYREHFIHQFHTFVLGLLIIVGIGVDKFVQWANGQLKAREIAFRKPPFDLDESSIIRIWFMTSFYHDYAYILQRIDEGMGGFIEKILRLEQFRVKNDWSQVFRMQDQASNCSKPSEIQGFSRRLTDMSTYFVSGEWQTRGKVPTDECAKLVDQVWNAVLTRQDHGPLSALVLLDSLTKHPDINTKQLYETYLAALAIACHHEGVFKEISHAGEDSFLTLEGFPFLFLLVYCDTAQEWGRRKKKEKPAEAYTSPRLESIEVDADDSLGPEARTVETTICYDSNDLNLIPTEAEIKRLTGSKTQSFKSRNYTFIIRYTMANELDKDSGEGARSTEITSVRFERVGPKRDPSRRRTSVGA